MQIVTFNPCLKSLFDHINRRYGRIVDPTLTHLLNTDIKDIKTNDIHIHVSFREYYTLKCLVEEWNVNKSYPPLILESNHKYTIINGSQTITIILTKKHNAQDPYLTISPLNQLDSKIELH